MKKTLILGVGNTLLGNDGVGIEVVRKLKEDVKFKDVDIEETSEAGINLLAPLVGYEKLIIVDSIQTRAGKAGAIYRFRQKDLKSSSRLRLSHNTGISTVLALGKKMRLSLPKKVTFFAVEIEKEDVFGEGFTGKVKEAIPMVVELIKKEV